MTDKEHMVQMQIKVPKATRDAMQRIWARTGLTLSQQARHSLSLWVQACERDEKGIQRRAAVRELRRTQARAGSVPAQPPAPPPPMGHDDPEPDIRTDPVAWSAWSARQGNQAIANLAKGYWPGDE